MPDPLRQHIDEVMRGSSLTAYLVLYRLSTKAEESLLGDRTTRYEKLVEKLEKLEGEDLSLFEDEGHISTSSWLVRSTLTANELGGKLHNGLDKKHDHLAVFEVADGNRWSMPMKGGDRA